MRYIILIVQQLIFFAFWYIMLKYLGVKVLEGLHGPSNPKAILLFKSENN